MSGLEVVGLALAIKDALVNTISAWEKRREARRELPTLVTESKRRVERIRAYIDRYSRGIPENSIPGDVLKKAGDEFIHINEELPWDTAWAAAVCCTSGPFVGTDSE